MASLYDYVGDYKMLQDLIDNETVTVEEVAEALAVIEDNIGNKVQNISYLIKEFDAKANLFKEEEKRLKERKQTYENKVKSLKEYLLTSLEAVGLDKVEAGTFTVRKQKNPPSVKIIDENAIPEQYKIPQPNKIDTAKIKEDLKNGAVSGAEIAPATYHIRIQ